MLSVRFLVKVLWNAGCVGFAVDSDQGLRRSPETRTEKDPGAYEREDAGYGIAGRPAENCREFAPELRFVAPQRGEVCSREGQASGHGGRVDPAANFARWLGAT